MVFISKEGDNFFYHRIKNETFYGILMIAFGAIVLVLVLYLITKVCACDDDDEHTSKCPQPFPGNPIFAHELTPGTIVLQSANGEYFRILHEYSSTHNDNTHCRTDRSSTFAYPDTGRVRMEHEQIQRTPTAPAFDNDMVTNTHNTVMIQPPPYNSTWR